MRHKLSWALRVDGLKIDKTLVEICSPRVWLKCAPLFMPVDAEATKSDITPSHLNRPNGSGPKVVATSGAPCTYFIPSWGKTLALSWPALLDQLFWTTPVQTPPHWARPSVQRITFGVANFSLLNKKFAILKVPKTALSDVTEPTAVTA